MLAFFGVKGGVGTSVTTVRAAMAAPSPSLVVDLTGDLADVVGLELGADAAGLGDWCHADGALSLDSLHALEVKVGDGLWLLPRGRRAPTERVATAISVLAADPRNVCIDAGRSLRPPPAFSVATSVLVANTTVLAAARLGRTSGFDHLVAVNEPSSRLCAADLGEIARLVPVCLAWDSRLERALEARLVVDRPPKRSIRKLAALWN